MLDFGDESSLQNTPKERRTTDENEVCWQWVNNNSFLHMVHCHWWTFYRLQYHSVRHFATPDIISAIGM